MNRKINTVLLLMCTLPLMASCKKITSNISYCESVNMNRAKCSQRKHYCEQALAVTKQEVINKVRACPAGPPPDVYVLSDPYPETAEISCCLSAPAQPLPLRR